MTRDEFFAKWKTEADTMRRRGVMVEGATLCEEILHDLESVLRAEEDRLLSLTEAAALSGYNPDHLGRMIREGKIQNAGRKGSPRIRARDLPRRPGSRPRPQGSYDPEADARAIVAKKYGLRGS
jgi:hypothetical protein